MVDRRGVLRALAALAGAVTAFAGPPSVRTSATSSPAAAASTSSAPSASSVSGTILLSSVPWGKAFADYMRALHDKHAGVESLDAARRKFESAFGAGPTTASTKPAERSAIKVGK